MLTRRAFLARSASSTAAAGFSVAALLDFLSSRALAAEVGPGLRFGGLEPLASLIEDTPPDALLVALAKRIRAGERLDTIVAACALANARTFGGENYDGYHCFMALVPALRMSERLPASERALPVLKVVHRTATRIQGHGGRSADVLATDLSARPAPAEASFPRPEQLLRDRVHASDLAGAEAALAPIAALGGDASLAALAPLVRDEMDVHRVVLAWRAFETARYCGADHLGTLMRQFVHYCTLREKDVAPRNAEVRGLVPDLVEEHSLRGAAGNKRLEPAKIVELAEVCEKAASAAAAKAMAVALADGIDAADLGEALSLAASRLLLADHGIASKPTAEKPLGSVHGASIGVHASDSAHAWRNLARTLSDAAAPTLIAAAYHTGGQAARLGERFSFTDRSAELASATADESLDRLDAAIGSADQAGACAAAARYLAAGGDGEALIGRMLRFAVADDGALHAEKYFVTATDVYRSGHPALRDTHLVALARVCASQHVVQADSVAVARSLLG